MASTDNAKFDIPLAPVFLTGAASGFLIFTYGLFSIAAQTLIFREFITSFESNDITIGIFFGCWFLWIALGAIVVNKCKLFAEMLLSNIELLFLAYLPAFVLQILLIIHIRQLAGIAPYTLLTIPTALFLSALVNAPLSFITGLLFPLTCRWLALDTTPAVSRVYLLESLGSFIGGLGTTLLLSLGVNPVRIFLLLASILLLAVLASLLSVPAASRFYRKITAQVVFLIVLLCCVALAVRAYRPFSDFIRTARWTQLLPADSLAGSFQTAQAEYLYGTYQNQWVVVREGAVVEAVPDPTSAGRIIALSLSQNPKASRVLIVGSGLGLCRQFLQLPQINHLVWANPDNEYIRRVLELAPPQSRISDTRFETCAADLRSTLGRRKEQFDLVIVNLPDVTSSVLNRYFTLEFYQQLKTALGSSGVLAVRIPAGENIMGTELVTIGASAKLTLEQAFSHLTLVPGDNAWLIASDNNDVTSDPDILRQRFASVKNAENIYPSAGLLSIYLPDRAAKAIDAYNSSDLPAKHLLNRDSRPLANLYALLLAAKQSDAPVTILFKLMLLVGLPVFLVPLIIYVILRLIFALTAPISDKPSTFDLAFLVFSAGLVGIGLVIVLMYLYQTRFGSLYLHIGAISSLYMAGLTGGAVLAACLLRNREHREHRTDMLLLTVLPVHCAVLAAIALCPAEIWSHITFVIAFILSGLCAGCYFPIAARLLADLGFATTPAAARIQYADHFGAAAGGILVSLAFVPILGAKITILMFLLLLLANLPPVVLKIRRRATTSVAPVFRAVGYTLFGIAASLIVCSNLLSAAANRLTPVLSHSAAQALAGSLRIEPVTATLPHTAKIAHYFKTWDAGDKLAGYVFSSDDLAPQARGFGGKINLAIHTDTAGNLLDFHIIRSNETPAYLDMLTNWLASLKGHRLFSDNPFANVDAVTGATVSSKAVLQSLSESGNTFAAQILGQTVQQKTTTAAYRWPDAQAAYLLAALLLTLFVIYRGGFWSRLFILASDVLIAGVLLNAQFSTEQIVSLLSLATPFAALTGVFILTIGAPILALLFGNIYCGYLCPFGALQELIGLLLPARFKPSLSIDYMRKARFVKFAILFVLIAAFFLSRSHDSLAADPLIKAFNFKYHGVFLSVIVAVALIGSLFYSRFWCRYLCPAAHSCHCSTKSLFSHIGCPQSILPIANLA